MNENCLMGISQVLPGSYLQRAHGTCLTNYPQGQLWDGGAFWYST